MRMELLKDEITITLVENAQKGRDAFEQLVRRYQQDVFRIIRIYTKNNSDAEDLAQETWIKVHRSLADLKDPGRFESWLKAIAVNTAKNWLSSRARKESRATDEIQPQQLLGSAMVQHQRQKLLEEIRDAIESLSAKNREVVYDFYICGYSAAEVSQRSNIPVSTVHSRLKEARKKLREEFASMVAASGIQKKFAPDNFVRNVMERVYSLPTPVPKGNIIERIGRMLRKNILPTIGIATFIAFAVIGVIFINLGKLQFGGDGNQKGNAMINVRAQAPEQTQIVFMSTRGGNPEIYVMDADGKNQRNLTNNPAEDGYPDWFDPAFGRSVSFADKLKAIWGWLKRSE